MQSVSNHNSSSTFHNVEVYDLKSVHITEISYDTKLVLQFGRNIEESKAPSLIAPLRRSLDGMTVEITLIVDFTLKELFGGLQKLWRENV